MTTKFIDVDERISEVIELIKEKGATMSQDELMLLELEVSNHFEVVKDVATNEYINKVQHCLLLLEQLNRKE